ncbi:hypothetical protein CDAR_412381 [Caerostris darwini]|uniref:Uncharacterized protein n=1 Tax=Caerostris darwini TaxID=1538125 RepID=A0AAV4SYM7_9ARAC|nr:hypothetical protein CDAR_412381 [Caerostris darwini]
MFIKTQSSLSNLTISVIIDFFPNKPPHKFPTPYNRQYAVSTHSNCEDPSSSRGQFEEALCKCARYSGPNPKCVAIRRNKVWQHAFKHAFSGRHSFMMESEEFSGRGWERGVKMACPEGPEEDFRLISFDF